MLFKSLLPLTLLSFTALFSSAIPISDDAPEDVLSPYSSRQFSQSQGRLTDIPTNFKLVNLRIEGQFLTIYEGPILTSPHNITTPSSHGPHRCDGTNRDHNPKPGATITTALDDAARTGRFKWDGEWYPSFEDFLITEIADEAESWSLYRNWNLTKVGGCQEQVKNFDDVLIACDAFSMMYLLKLESEGGRFVKVGEKVKVKVTDGRDGVPVVMATVEGNLTDKDGETEITFAEKGLKYVKAFHDQGIRSNAVVFVVY